MQTLSALLSPLLSLAKECSGRGDLDIEMVTGLKNSLPADRIEFAKGRNDKEIAVVLFVGKVELSFVPPVEMLFNKFAELTKRIKQVPDNM